jgi:predicted dehydrogenase
MTAGPPPLRLAFLGCGFITRVHSGHLRTLRPLIVPSYASRDRARAEDYRRRFGGDRAFSSYEDAIADPAIDAVVVAVPPKHHLDLTLRALDAGKHVWSRPASPTMADFEIVCCAQRTGRVIIVGENDHYKPLGHAAVPAGRR